MQSQDFNDMFEKIFLILNVQLYYYTVLQQEFYPKVSARSKTSCEFLFLLILARMYDYEFFFHGNGHRKNLECQFFRNSLQAVVTASI